MPQGSSFAGRELTRAEIDQLPGPVALEFGAEWCGYCQAVAPLLAAELKNHPQVRHIRIEDGKGQPLGRSFRVKLWPTLVFLKDGQIVRRLVRPELSEIQEGLEALRTF
jgi:thioredoxin 1